MCHEAVRVLHVKHTFILLHYKFILPYNKQLLDEVEHDIMNYQNRGLCYLPQPITKTRGFDNS